MLTDLLEKRGVRAILVNERGAEQAMIEMLQARGIEVTRLMDNQSGGRDDRQLLLKAPSAAAAIQLPIASPFGARKGSAWADSEDEDEEPPPPPTVAAAVFPNVPYEENKYN